MAKAKIRAFASVVFELTVQQMEQIKPLYDLAHEAALAGEPGMIIAQCDTNRNFRVGFVKHAKAKQIVAIMGNSLDDCA